MEPENVKSSAFSLVMAMWSILVGWINVSTAKETIIVALISTLVGYLGSKFLKRIECLIKQKFFKKDEEKA
jgi:uncharacterized membrane protein YfcA